jgi:glucokinase
VTNGRGGPSAPGRSGDPDDPDDPEGTGDPGGPSYGVDVGGTKILGVALTDECTVLAEFRVPTPQQTAGPGRSGRPAEQGAVADAVASVVHALQQEHGPGPVGVGVAGMLDRSGVLRFAPNLRGAAGMDVRAALTDRLGRAPAHLDNDANCGALAELTLGAARGSREALMVTLGTGIGGALILDGKVQGGAHGMAGELGHMVVDPSGPRCPCGNRGCWERYASGAGLARLARDAALAGGLDGALALAGGDPELVRGEHVARAAAAGDPGSLAVIETLGWWIALGLANLVAVVDPERIVVGGGLAEVGELLFAPTRRAFISLVEGGPARPAVPIVHAALGERASAIGAAVGAREAFAAAG